MRMDGLNVIAWLGELVSGVPHAHGWFAWDIDEETGEHNHSEFGPATGYCEECDSLFVDSFEGAFVYRKSKSKRKS